MTPHALTEHPCVFYDDETYLATRVATFVAPAFPAAQAVLVIGTPPHVEAIEREMRRAGHDVDAARTSGQYVSLDAHNTLGELMKGALPTREGFERTVGTRIARLANEYRGVRAFGELVNVLWRGGRRQAALRLEDLWNEALGYHSIALLCGYSVRSFRQRAEAPGLTGIIDRHTTTSGPAPQFRS